MSAPWRVLCRIGGLALVTAGVALFSPPAGLIVLGLGLAAWGYRGGI